MEVLGFADVSNTLLLSIILSALIYWYFTRNFDYWKTRGVPYAKPYPFLGSMGMFPFRPFHTEEIKRYKKYGRLYGGFEGRKPYISIGDPALVKNVMVKDFFKFADRRDVKTGINIFDKMVGVATGEHWKRLRSIMSPVFTSGKLRKLHAIINDSGVTFRRHCLMEARRGNPIDVNKFFGAFTMDVILTTAFGTKVDSLSDPNNRLVFYGKELFRQGWRFYAFLLFPEVMKFFRIGAFGTEAASYLKDFTYQLMKERTKSEKKRNDFLQLLLDASEETDVQDELDKECAELAHEERNRDVFKKSTNKILSSEEIVAQSVLFMAAGYDTTASTLSFIAYNLALNPDCQEKLIKEIDEAYTEKEEIDYERIQSMKYLDAVISETLRMHPPLARTERLCTQDCKLEEAGITIPKAMIVTIPIHPMHYDPEFFPEPEKFRPERFLPENKSDLVPYSYLPFGLGPRNCLGMRFAIIEIKICLINIMRHCRFKRCQQTKVPPDYIPGNFLTAPRSLVLKIEERNDIPAA